MNELLTIENLAIEFDTESGPVRAVDGVSLPVRPGEILGVVGESGCGKRVTALSLPCACCPRRPGASNRRAHPL